MPQQRAAGGLTRVCALLLVSQALPACAHDVYVRMPDATDVPSGTVEVLFSRVARDVSVAIEGRLVAKRKHTERVVIRDVPAGLVELSIVAGSGQSRVERYVRVEVDPNRVTTLPIAAPERSAFSDLPSSIVTILAVIAARLVYFALL